MHVDKSYDEFEHMEGVDINKKTTPLKNRLGSQTTGIVRTRAQRNHQRGPRTRDSLILSTTRGQQPRARASSPKKM